MSDKKKQQEKIHRVTVQTLVEILSGESTYRDESQKLKKLGMDTGPDLEDKLLELKEALETIQENPNALDGKLEGTQAVVAGAVCDRLVALQAVTPLVRLREQVRDREVLKVLGAAFHKLALKGVAVPTQSAVVAPPPNLKLATPECYLSPPGIQNQSAVQIFLAGTRDGDFFYTIILDENRGLGGFYPEQSGARSRRRDLLELIQGGSPHAPLQVSPSHALFVLDEALDRARSKHTQLPFELTYLVRDLKELYGIQPEQALPADPEMRAPREYLTQEEFARILSTPEIGQWTIPNDHLQQAIRHIAEGSQASLIVSDQTRDQQITSLRDVQANDYFSPSRRLIFARRLEELALRLEARGEKETVGLVWGSAQALKDLSKPITSITFANYFYEANLGMYLQQLLPQLEQMKAQGRMAGSDFDLDAHGHAHGHAHDEDEHEHVCNDPSHHHGPPARFLPGGAGQGASGKKAERSRIILP